jgi:hypothetical protein
MTLLKLSRRPPAPTEPDIRSKQKTFKKEDERRIGIVTLLDKQHKALAVGEAEFVETFGGLELKQPVRLDCKRTGKVDRFSIINGTIIPGFPVGMTLITGKPGTMEESGNIIEIPMGTQMTKGNGITLQEINLTYPNG